MTARTQAEVVVDSLIEAVCANIAADPHVAAGFKNMGESASTCRASGDKHVASGDAQVARLKTYRVDMDLGGQIDWMDVRAANPEEAMWEALDLVDEYTRKSAAFITVSVGER